MSGRFVITRHDGRSNAQVLIASVRGAPAGKIFTYEDLQRVLSEGTTRQHTVSDVQRIVTESYPRLLKELACALHNVRNVGYRVAPAAHHVALASDRQMKADKQMLRGLQTLQNVRWDEMDENQRRAHEGQLLITGALFRQMKALERRQSAVEDAIASVRSAKD